VTIVAGFRSYEGLVLCADTQETVADLSKRNVPKLIFHPVDYLDRAQAPNTADLAVAFCGAANNGPFVDKLVERAWQSAQAGDDLDSVCQLVERSITDTYKEFGEIYQSGYCPAADLLYGVKMLGSSKLFSATGPIVVEQKRYYSGGAGYYMADFLAGRMYHDSMSLRQCVILAAYILFQAKEHVDGCGGDSQIAVLRNHGASGKVDWISIEAINDILKRTDHELGSLILEVADLETSDKEFSESVERLKVITQAFREMQKDDYDNRRSFTLLGGPPEKVDEFGLPMPSDSETLEDQQ
jgi:20S proteasome alpha/beta subunit